MKSTIEELNPVQLRVHVELSSDEVAVAFEDVFRRLQKKARIQGFRPGKAPINIIKKVYGQQVAAEVHESLVNKHLFIALEEKTLRPIAAPVLETGNSPLLGQAFNFSAVVDIMPRLDFDDYNGLTVTAPRFSVGDGTFEKEIESLRRQHARTRSVEAGTKASAGLVALVSHSAADGGVDLPSFRVDKLAVHLGQGQLFSGLEDLVLGLGVGESCSGDVTLPANYEDADYSGKTLAFSVTLNDLQHYDLPTVDDDFAKDLGYADKDGLSEDVRAQLDRAASRKTRQALEAALLDKIVGAHPFEVPPAMVDQVIDSLIGELPHRSEDERRQALKNEGLREHFLQTAKRRTQNTLILWHIAQREKIAVNEEELDGKVQEVLSSLGVSDAKQAAKMRRSVDARLRENLLFDKAMELLINRAQVTETPASL